MYVSDKLHITYSSSSGPGGQNVNMVNTKVDLRFHVASADWISKDIRDNILEQVKNYMTHQSFKKSQVQSSAKLWCSHRLKLLSLFSHF